MKKSLYLLVIFALLIQPVLGTAPGASAREAGEAPQTPSETTLYVTPSGTGDCTSWGNACELQAALSAAGTGDQVWVAQGIYTPTLKTEPGNPRTATFQLEGGVALYGGFYPRGGADTFEARDPAAYITVLSGDLDGDDDTDPDGVITDTLHIKGSNAYHVVTGSGVDETAVLDGFTITAGYANASSPWDAGGGMYNNSGSPSIANVTFSGNHASITGGGMFNLGGSNVQLENLLFRWNSSSVDGGGLYNWSSSPTITNVTFRDNRALNAGGGMFNNDSSPTLVDCTFSGNSARYDGGGMYNAFSSPSLAGCTFTSNSADLGNGGGMYNWYSSAPLTNVTLADNSASIEGGGMYNLFSSPLLTNCTFTGNSAASGGGMYNASSSPSLTNCILWGTSSEIFNGLNSAPVVVYSDIEGGCEATGSACGAGNLNADPLFLDAAGGDLHLSPGSPAIDAGSNAAPNLPTYDFEGDPRILDGDGDGIPTVDMGVDEFHLPVLYLPLLIR